MALDARLSKQMMLKGGTVVMSTRKLLAAAAIAVAVAVADVVAVAVVAVATCSHFVLQFATVCRVCTSYSVYCANFVCFFLHKRNI